MRMAQWPHQEAEGTRRTRTSAVHVRLCGRQCTEHWLLFARTPKREGGADRERERKSILMKTKMLNKMPERHSFLMLNNSIDLLNELVSRSLAQGTKSYLLKEDKGQ